VVDHSEHRRVSETDVELLELGGPADEFPANFFIFFFVRYQHDIRLRENLEKSYGP
jgi:hypothetical protein